MQRNMNEDILKLDAKKWSECCKYLKTNFNLLTEKERPAFEFLEKQWKELYNSRACEQFIQVLSKEEAKHGNNKELKEELSSFRGLCKKYYTKEEGRFNEFKDVLTSLAVPVGIRATEQSLHRVEDSPNSQHQSSRVSRVDLMLDNGDRYIGDFMNGLPTGKGTMIYHDGCRYEGDWNNGEWFGRGVFTDVSGRIDTGEYRRNVRVGSGRIVLPDGSRYEGGWNDEGPHGEGTFYYSDKSKYSGGWYNGKKHGSGIVTTSDGQKKKVRFNLGVLVEDTNTTSRNTITNTFSNTSDRALSRGQVNMPKNKPVVAFLAIIAFVALLFSGYYFFYIPYATDRDAPRYYTFTNLNLRSSEVGEVEYNLLDLLPYGSELITYSVGDEWANVKAHGKKGFVSSSLILPSEDFHLLNSIWGNSDAKECVATAKCRFALLDYFKRANLNGGTEWQLYTQKKDSKPNTVFYPRVYNKGSKFTDFAFLVKNNQTKKRMFVLYSFDDETEEPVYRYDMEAPEDGYINNVTGYWTNSGLRMTVAYSNGTRKTVTVAGNPPVGSSYSNNSVSSSNRSSSTVALPSTVDYSNMSAVDLNKEGDRQYDQQNYSTAFVCYQMAAQKGLLEAKANLGWMYYKGYGTQRNPDMAVKYLKEAADNGNANACYYMGLLSETGVDGTYKNTTTARYYYEKGGQLGQDDAQKRLQQLESQLNMQQEAAASGGQTVKINEDALYKTSDLSVQPEFPGGQNALLQFLSSSIVYPRVAQENGIQGTVYCSFVVERTGDITDIMITKGADGYLNAEALRVLRTMPNWKPGRIGNTPVRVRYTIPVKFRLQ